MNAQNNRPVQSQNEQQPLFNGFFDKVFKATGTRTAIDLSNSEGLQRYFLKIKELANSGEKFPINLDDVWPLIYSEKSKAVKALHSSHLFRKDMDYKVFALNGNNPRGGRPEKIYNLSTACLEYFIARKVRLVFEVYRQVFHNVTEQHPNVMMIGQKRNHNRLTKDRLLDIMIDVAKVDNTELRLSLIQKLGL